VTTALPHKNICKKWNFSTFLITINAFELNFKNPTSLESDKMRPASLIFTYLIILRIEIIFTPL